MILVTRLGHVDRHARLRISALRNRAGGRDGQIHHVRCGRLTAIGNHALNARVNRTQVDREGVVAIVAKQADRGDKTEVNWHGVGRKLIR